MTDAQGSLSLTDIDLSEGYHICQLTMIPDVHTNFKACVIIYSGILFLDVHEDAFFNLHEKILEWHVTFSLPVRLIVDQIVATRNVSDGVCLSSSIF